MEHIELLVFGLLVAISGLAALARVVQVPYPILLVIGGLVIGFVPGVPEVELDPDLVLLIFLPRSCTRRRSSRTCVSCERTLPSSAFCRSVS